VRVIEAVRSRKAKESVPAGPNSRKPPVVAGPLALAGGRLLLLLLLLVRVKLVRVRPGERSGVRGRGRVRAWPQRAHLLEVPHVPALNLPLRDLGRGEETREL
jgi:hypothetical protein